MIEKLVDGLISGAILGILWAIFFILLKINSSINDLKWTILKQRNNIVYKDEYKSNKRG